MSSSILPPNSRPRQSPLLPLIHHAQAHLSEELTNQEGLERINTFAKQWPSSYQPHLIGLELILDEKNPSPLDLHIVLPNNQAGLFSFLDSPLFSDSTWLLVHSFLKECRRLGILMEETTHAHPVCFGFDLGNCSSFFPKPNVYLVTKSSDLDPLIHLAFSHFFGCAPAPRLISLLKLRKQRGYHCRALGLMLADGRKAKGEIRLTLEVPIADIPLLANFIPDPKQLHIIQSLLSMNQIELQPHLAVLTVNVSSQGEIEPQIGAFSYRKDFSFHLLQACFEKGLISEKKMAALHFWQGIYIEPHLNFLSDSALGIRRLLSNLKFVLTPAGNLFIKAYLALAAFTLNATNESTLCEKMNRFEVH